ncbi:MAG: hypothetical protein M3436_19365 [Pseudomonadota bacterium]|nr:hypothetical protein [Pseudomonadota bacterium]
MNTKTLKGVALLLAGIASTGSAATLEGELESDRRATDTFRLDCYEDMRGARARVRDLDHVENKRAKMRVVMINCGVKCTDAQVDKRPREDRGEGGSPSDWAIRNNGNGVYNVFIFKTANDHEAYRVEATCRKVVNGSIKSVEPDRFKQCQDEKSSKKPCP